MSHNYWIIYSDDGLSIWEIISFHTFSSSKYTLLRRIIIVLVICSSSSNTFSFYSSIQVMILTSLSWAIPKYSTSRNTLKLVSRLSAGGWLIDSFLSHSISYFHMEYISSHKTNHHHNHTFSKETTRERLFITHISSHTLSLKSNRILPLLSSRKNWERLEAFRHRTPSKLTNLFRSISPTPARLSIETIYFKYSIINLLQELRRGIVCYEWFFLQ